METWRDGIRALGLPNLPEAAITPEWAGEEPQYLHPLPPNSSASHVLRKSLGGKTWLHKDPLKPLV